MCASNNTLHVQPVSSACSPKLWLAVELEMMCLMVAQVSLVFEHEAGVCSTCRLPCQDSLPLTAGGHSFSRQLKGVMHLKRQSLGCVACHSSSARRSGRRCCVAAAVVMVLYRIQVWLVVGQAAASVADVLGKPALVQEY